MNQRIVRTVASLTTVLAGCSAPDLDMSSKSTLSGEIDMHVFAVTASKTHRAFESPQDTAEVISAKPESSATAREKGPAAGNSGPRIMRSFNGLNHRDQWLANGNGSLDPIFDIEPPDQALCVGNGFIVEAVNRAIRVRNNAGNALSAPASLNSFFGRPPRFQNGVFGPRVFDPTCYFDPDVKRFFVVAIAEEADSLGFPTGENFIEFAVSNTMNPLGPWTLYHIAAVNDGTNGTPNHACATGSCLADFPHIGADENGIFISINEYDFLSSLFEAANIYAFSKAELASGAANATATIIRTKNAAPNGLSGFTLWPAVTPGGQYERDANGSEYFLSSDAFFDSVEGGQSSDHLILWALTNTNSLDDEIPALALQRSLVPVNTYTAPALASQKPGPTPLRECLNDTTTVTSAGVGCWRLVSTNEPPHNQVLQKVPGSDSRVLTLTYADGKLWSALGTSAIVADEERVGAAWFILEPTVTNTSVSAAIVKQGVLALENNNILYPTIAVTKHGSGIMGFSLVGEDFFPSAAYASMDAQAGVGNIDIAAAGVGPQDGFMGYVAEADFIADPRWGDYGAAVADGNSIWIASEYIAQTCSLATYIATNGSCGNQRNLRANWATRITELHVNNGRNDHDQFLGDDSAPDRRRAQLP